MATAAAPAASADLREIIAVQVVRKITDGAIAKRSVTELLSHVHLQTEQFSRRQAEIPTKSSAFSTIMMEICPTCRSIPLV
jgi:hypothetical protein